MFQLIPSRLVCGENANPVRTFKANEKVNVACVGVGGMGATNLRELTSLGANIVGLCDVDGRALAKQAKNYPGAKTWSDFRKMLDKQKEIDAVMVSTPDHLHYHMSMWAMQRGKGVCAEKPMAHSVWEARQMAEAARKYKVATQMDNEGHGKDSLRSGVEWLKADAIGDVREVHIWTDRPIWPQGMANRPPSKPVPESLNWDLWIGPAPFREYHDGLHRFKWRGWWDFGCGALGDMGCHHFDTAVWGLELGSPVSVEAEQEGNTAEGAPNWSIVTYKFAARKGKGGPQEGKDLPPVTLKWYDGGKMPSFPPLLEEEQHASKRPGGSYYVGDKGMMFIDGVANPRLVPKAKMSEFKDMQPFIPRVKSHKAEWLDAVKGGPLCGCDFGLFGSHLAETVLLGNVAIRSGKKIEWDSENLKARNADVSQFLRREYRKGWEI
jgi:predicted dehydrogenase